MTTDGTLPEQAPVSLDRLGDAKLHPNGPCERQGIRALISQRVRALFTIPSCTVGLLAVLVACGLAPHAKIALYGFAHGQSAAAGTARAGPAPGLQTAAPTERPLLERLQIRAGGELWPPFSPEIASYEVELQAPRPGEAPQLELEFALAAGSGGAAPGGARPRLRLDGEDLPAPGPGQGGALRWRAPLPELRPGAAAGARHRLLLLEVLAPEGAAGGRAYALRVLRPPEASGPRAARRLEGRGREEAPRAAAAAAAVGAGRALAPVPVAASRAAVGISLVGGHCARAAGPFHQPPRVSAPEGRLGLWRADTQHVLCFSPRGGSSEDEVQIVATAADEGSDAAQPGEFGFGPGVAVSLRPDIETSAVWPLEAGVQSLGLGIGSGESFRTLALRTRADGAVLDIPVVVARPARQRWPIALQLLNGSLGECLPAPALDVARFVCRTRKDAAGALAHFVVLCRTCMLGGGQPLEIGEASGAQRAWSVNVSDDKGRAVSTTSNAHDDLASGVPAPWIGWSAEVPDEGASQQWIVKLHRPPADVPSSEASMDQVDVTEFEVALVAGDGVVPWTLGPAEEGVFCGAGVGLSMLAVSMLAAVAAVLVLASCGFPAPTSAVLPPLSSACTVLQFLALLGSCASTPKLLRCICRPLAWIAPGRPADGLLQALLALLVVAVVHAAAVWRYLMLGGSGSARALPHGLVFGAWELRALPLLALPLSAAASALLAGAGAWYGPGALLGGALLGALVAAPACALRRLRAWFGDERVVRVPLAGSGHPVYTDRLCDQLRAMPVAPGRARLLGDWPASPGWCVAPAVAAIRDLEHRGAPVPGGPQGSWSAMWPPGPWAQQGAGAAPQTPRSGRGGYGRQGSTGSCHSGAGEGAGFRKDLMSPVYNEHPIRATLEFAYEGKKHPCIAGVVGLPWVDAAVLAGGLRGIQALVAGLELQVHAGQLSGPLTGGRLAACFEWGDRQPWRWAIDMLVKVFLGAYVGMLSCTRPPVVDSQVLWHGAVSGAVALLAVAVMAVQPYFHLMDNLALMFSLLAISLAIALRALGEQLPRLAPGAAAGLVALSLAPALLAAAAAALAAAFGALWRRRGLHERVVPMTVHEWGSSSRGARGSTRRARDDTYIGVWCEDGPFSPVIDNASAYSHTADLVLLSLSDGIGATKSRICLPAELKISLVHRELHGNPREKAHASPVCAEGLRVPVPASLLFAPEREGLDRAAAKPFAALLTPHGGQLLYLDAALNGGVSWNEAVQCFFHDDQALAKEAEDILREHEREVPPEASGEGLMVVLEFNGPMERSTQPSWRTCR